MLCLGPNLLENARRDRSCIVLVLPPVEVVAPDAVGAGQIVALDSLQELVDVALAGPVGPPGPGIVDGTAGEEPHADEEGHKADQDSVDQAGTAFGSCSVKLGRIHQGHVLGSSLVQPGASLFEQKNFPQPRKMRRLY
jgi:hypothetical protein